MYRILNILRLRKRCPHSELFWSVFSRIRTDYGEIRNITAYSVRIRENTEQNNSEYGHFSRSASILLLCVFRPYLLPFTVCMRVFCELLSGESKQTKKHPQSLFRSPLLVLFQSYGNYLTDFSVNLWFHIVAIPQWTSKIQNNVRNVQEASYLGNSFASCHRQVFNKSVSF